jgi:predicted dehydrogenase
MDNPVEMLTYLMEGRLVSKKKRYAAVGTGHRINMFIDSLANQYREYADIVGLCDLSLTRANYHRNRLQQQYSYGDIPTYAAHDFERMIREQGVDTVIVCTIDSTHHDYIIRALECGCDAITEKPLTTDAQKCADIFAAIEHSGKNVRVAFNARWIPGSTKVREVIASGVIGEIKAVNMEYQLDTSHGADYFRRWHATKEYSGGLQIHKSTHHFDQVNWWINAIPEEVFAHGSLKFYGKKNAIARGHEDLTRYDRYTGVSEAADDPFALTLENERFQQLYADAEAESGYIRDRNVFRDEIDIEDTLSVLVKYRTGVQLTYSLVAYSPNEGVRVSFSGDKGRLEYLEMYNLRPIIGEDDSQRIFQSLRVIPHFENGYDVEIPTAKGGHGGSDPQLQEQMFHPQPQADKWHRNAGHEQGAASMLIGVAINQSIATGQPVSINELCPLRPHAQRLAELI